jgi:hypothetical protein
VRHSGVCLQELNKPTDYSLAISASPSEIRTEYPRIKSQTRYQYSDLPGLAALNFIIAWLFSNWSESKVLKRIFGSECRGNRGERREVLLHILRLNATYESVSKSFRSESIKKYTLTTINIRWEATQRVMAAKLPRLTHKITTKLHLVGESLSLAVLAPGGQSGNFWIHPRISYIYL